MRLGWGHDDGAFFFSRPDAAQQECCEPGFTLLCMGLFSRFFVQALPCTAEGTVCRVRDTRSLVPRAYGTNRSSSNTSCSSRSGAALLARRSCSAWRPIQAKWRTVASFDSACASAAAHVSRDRYRLEFRRFARHTRNSRYNGSSRSCLLAPGASTAADAAAAPADGKLRSTHSCAAGKRVQPATGAFSATSFHFGWNGGRCNCATRVNSDSTSKERRR